MQAYVPYTLDEALALRAAYPDAAPVAGGTDLMVEVNLRNERPTALLDLSRVTELAAWHRRDGIVFLGAGMTFARIATELPELTALVDAARTVGSPQIRNRATIGGNVATASPAGDSLPVLAALDGEIVLASAARGARNVGWERFFKAPKRTCLAPDELVVGVELRAPDGPGSFAKVGPRSAMVIAVASVCVQLLEAPHAVHVGLGSVGPTVRRAPEAEAFGATLVGWGDPESLPTADALDEFGRLAAAAAHPIDDLRGSATYRRHVVDRLSRRSLAWALVDRKVAWE